MARSSWNVASVLWTCTKLSIVMHWGQPSGNKTSFLGEMQVRDLDFAVEIVGCPLIREEDGLAMSSRNVRLSAAERQDVSTLTLNLWLEWWLKELHFIIWTKREIKKWLIRHLGVKSAGNESCWDWNSEILGFCFSRCYPEWWEWVRLFQSTDHCGKWKVLWNLEKLMSRCWNN